MQYFTLAFCFTALFSGTRSLAVPDDTSHGPTDDGFAHYATYHFRDLGHSLDFYVGSHMHSGQAPMTIMMDSSASSDGTPGFVPNTTELRRLEDRDLADVCEFLRGCVIDIASQDKTTALVALANVGVSKCASAAQTVWYYFSDDNYANARTLAAYATNNLVLPWAIGIASTAFTNVYLNGESGAEDPFPQVSTSDMCTTEDYKKLATDQANMLYDFCMYIVNTDSLSSNPTHYTAGQLKSDNSEIDGAVNLARMNVAATKGKMQAKCSSVGVIWKRWLPTLAWMTGV